MAEVYTPLSYKEDAATASRIRLLAEVMGCSVSDILRTAVLEYVDRKSQEPAVRGAVQAKLDEQTNKYREFLERPVRLAN